MDPGRIRYLGHEALARVVKSDAATRRLVRLRPSGEDLPPHRAPVTRAGRYVGLVGAVTRHVRTGPTAPALVDGAMSDHSVVLAGRIPALVDPHPSVAG